jgi:hypothetical protein
VGSGFEERAYFITTHRVRQLLGTDDAAGLAIAGLVVGAIGMLLLIRSRPERRWLALTAIVGLTFMIQNEASWNWQIHTTRALRSNFPTDLAWMQDDVKGDISEVLTSINTPEAAIASFFSPNVTRLYKSGEGVVGVDLVGGSCNWIVNNRGQVSFDRACGPDPTRLYLDTHGVRLTFRGERVLADRGRLARVVEVPRQPQLVAFIYQACGTPGPRIIQRTGEVRPTPSAQCGGSLTGYVFPQKAANLRVHYRGGTEPHYVSVNGVPRSIPAGARVTVDLPFTAGPQQFKIDEDWTQTAGAPTVDSAELVEGQQSQRVL